MNKTFFKVGRAVVAFMFVLSMSMPAFADHGVELAAAGITPQSSFLYFFDRLTENIRQLVTRNPNSKAELADISSIASSLNDDIDDFEDVIESLNEQAEEKGEDDIADELKEADEEFEDEEYDIEEHLSDDEKEK